jgi:hypothetical protein
METPAMTIHYAVAVDGIVIGSRSSASGRQYTHAVVVDEGAGTWGVMSYHSSEALARDTARTWGARERFHGKLYVKPVTVTPRRAKEGAAIAEVLATPAPQRLPKRYELRIILADGSPRAFFGNGFNKDDARAEAMQAAMQTLGDAIRTATVHSCERVQ